MQLTDIPREVIDAGVLPYLHWNDLLRFRRVCSWTKDITNAYLQVNPEQAPEIEIDEGTEKTFEAFLAMGIPTTKLFLNNQSGYAFYEKFEEEIQRQFLDKYGPLIKHLRVFQMFYGVFGRELNFINGLKNLKSFEAGYLSEEKNRKWSDTAILLLKQAVAQAADRYLKCRDLPEIFKSLESIKIGQDDDFVKTFDIVQRSADIFFACPQLKYACHPFDSTFKHPEVGAGRTQEALLYEALPRAFHNVIMYTNPRPNEYYASDANGCLEYYDFENFHHENIPWTMESALESHAKLQVCWTASFLFMRVCLGALKTGLKLLNVNPTWYCARFQATGANYSSPALGIPVVSLVGLDPCVMELKMPNLEKITIPFTSGSVPGLGTRPEWPALKCVDITVDYKYGNIWDVDRKARLEDIERTICQPTLLLFQFLFGNGVVCENMTELSIQFVEGKGKREIAVPKSEDIVTSCPNLKKIKLGNWMGTNKQLVELWEGLSGLEEICLENCKELGNVAFVGEDVEFPVILSLENLKKLSLNGLDKMPKITDTLFCLVLSKMNLQELELTSDEPVEKVTKKGITVLLEGPFAETIERFPFQDWSLADMTAQEFQEMGNKFRSYDMI